MVSFLLWLPRLTSKPPLLVTLKYQASLIREESRQRLFQNRMGCVETNKPEVETLRARQEAVKKHQANIKLMHTVLRSDQVVTGRRKGRVESQKTYKRRSGCDGSQ
jgi:hypothetical protein